MSLEEESATWIPIPDDSPDNSALAILRIVKDEGTRLGAVWALEENKEKNISNRVRVSLKLNGKTFRITLSWVRDECLAQGLSGNGYIETDWNLKLRCKEVKHPSDPYGLPPFRWHMEKYLTDEEKQADQPIPRRRILDADFLRQLIREKLGVLPPT